MKKFEFWPRINDLEVGREMRQKGMRIIRLIPGRQGSDNKPDRNTIVWAVEDE